MPDPVVGEPRLLINTGHSAASARADAAGAIWRLATDERDLDANIIALPAAGVIEKHWGPDLDVLFHVISGSGRLTTDLGAIDMQPGDLVWLPRRSARQITAGREGMRYLTIHRRRQALVLDPPGAPRAGSGT